VTEEGGLIGAHQVVEDVAALQLERSNHGHHARGEEAARLAVTSKADFAIEDRGSEAPLGEVVGRLDACRLDEGPQRRVYAPLAC
jgi:hypothetical protein